MQHYLKIYGKRNIKNTTYTKIKVDIGFDSELLHYMLRLCKLCQILSEPLQCSSG